ncbi:MAG: hypothetical protein WCD76_12455 [Pyrinomonadaceae bacterium]
MAAQPNFNTRFIRKTRLSANEYHKNFYKLDEEIIGAITSGEADKVTPLMSKIYLRLVNAPNGYWEREGVLRFEAQCREGKQVKAWDVLCETLGVASATANKAMTWLHAQGIIGYFAGKNGVGLRIFLNRAATSIGMRGASAGQKILRFAPASTVANDASPNEPAFNDPFGDSDGLDKDFNSDAPKNGADTKTVDKKVLDPKPPFDSQSHAHPERERREAEVPTHSTSTISINEIVERLRNELEPCVKRAATEAAAQTATREIARTREWFETKALPKAVRVAQHETYALLKKHGQVDARQERARSELQVGRATEDSYTKPVVAHPLTTEEIQETAETCVALLEAQGKSVEVTLAEISAEGGGWLLLDDAPKVRDQAERLLRARSERR